MGLARSMRRRWGRWLLALGLSVVVLAVGVPFAYIHFVEGKAPAPLRLSAAPSATTVAGATTSTTAASTVASGGTVALDGVWKVTSGSQAGYRIKETLVSRSITAVGRTTAVTGPSPSAVPR